MEENRAREGIRRRSGVPKFPSPPPWPFERLPRKLNFQTPSKMKQVVHIKIRHYELTINRRSSIVLKSETLGQRAVTAAIYFFVKTGIVVVVVFNSIIAFPGCK